MTEKEQLLRALKDKRALYQQRIDQAIKDLNTWTEEKQKCHYDINRVKREIREEANEVPK